MSGRSIESAMHVRLTNRDRQTLRRVAELRCVRLDDLARLLSGPGKPPIAARTTRNFVARLRRLELCESTRITTGPSVISVTRMGASWVDYSGPVGLPSHSATPHVLTTAAIASVYLNSGADWITESMLRSDCLADGTQHRPDGVAIAANGARVAVEVERSRKSASRWAGIIDWLTDADRQWTRVHYWTADDVTVPFTKWLTETYPPSVSQLVVVREIGDLAR